MNISPAVRCTSSTSCTSYRAALVMLSRLSFLPFLLSSSWRCNSWS